MISPALEFRKVGPDLKDPLARFFRVVREFGDHRHFHPHPLNLEAAENLSHYDGRDLYYVMIEGEEILGYGMLRGWDEGFDIPSLGIIIHPKLRGQGIGRAFMEFLHIAAKRRQAKSIRLKVYSTNTIALALYKRLGYEFEASQSDQLIGVLKLE